jgi:hypothetical protein
MELRRNLQIRNGVWACGRELPNLVLQCLATGGSGSVCRINQLINVCARGVIESDNLNVCETSILRVFDRSA